MKSAVIHRKEENYKTKKGVLKYAHRGKNAQKNLCPRVLNQSTLNLQRNELEKGIQTIAIHALCTLVNMKNTHAAT